MFRVRWSLLSALTVLSGLSSCGSDDDSSAGASGSGGPAGSSGASGSAGLGGAAGAATGGTGATSNGGAGGSGAAGGTAAAGGTGGSSGSGGAPVGSLGDQARALAQHMSGSTNFLVGLGNDNDGPFDQGIPIDVHYTYLVGYGDQGGWTTWNTDAGYVTYRCDNAYAHGVAPMFTYYQLALELENSNVGVFTDDTRMRQYLLDVQVLYERLAAFGHPAMVHFEPDFFGYLQIYTEDHSTTPDQMPASIHHADFHACDAIDETVTGLMECLIHMARSIAPEVRVGFSASRWGSWYDSTDPNADIEGSAESIADFLRSVGSDDTDFIIVETLDRDAGFWETSGGGVTCSVTDGPRGPVYWDETNATLPNFQQHFRFVGALTERLQRPAFWWQTPLGVPSNTCGGTSEHWRDNRVSYFFSHIDEMVAAGGFGMAFGTGAGEQTDIHTDGGQFHTAATSYAASPFAL